ncbi:MAG: CBS domain-containing protein [Kiloniellales bacterium]
MKIREVMSNDVHLVDPKTPIKEVAMAMRDKDFGLVPIGENDRLVGMVSDRDIALRAVAEGKDPTKTAVGDIMSPEIFYCFEDQMLEEARDIMAKKQIRRIPVVDRDKRLVGIVSLGDMATESHAERHAAAALTEISKPRAAA